MKILNSLMCITLVAGCAGTVRAASYKEPVVERLTDNANNRPEWITNQQDVPGFITIVTTSTSALSTESGVRLAKAYALAQLAEQLEASVKTQSQLNTRNSAEQVSEQISWNAAAVLKSLRQKNVYWESRETSEGIRYSVWVQWLMPEKAFYRLQEETSK